jgi:hypothetical protein
MFQHDWPMGKDVCEFSEGEQGVEQKDEEHDASSRENTCTVYISRALI